MDFVPLGSPSPWSYVAMIAGFGLFIGALALIFYRPNKFWTLLAPMVVLLGVIGAAFGVTSLNLGPLEHKREAIRDQIEKTYGLELTNGEIRSLGYPSDRPESDFEVFGSFHKNQKTSDGFERTEVFLVWDSGEMLLASSTDGETFENLESR